MNPQDFEALAPLYALDALDGEDLALFRVELQRSETLRELVQEYRAAATTLPRSLDPVAPSPDVKARLLDAVAPARPRSAPVFTRVFWAAAALLLFTVLIQSLRQPDPEKRVLDMNGTEKHQAVAGTVTVSGRSVSIAVKNLPKLPTGKCYQLWVIGADGVPVPHGTFHADESGLVAGCDGVEKPLQKNNLFAITMEPVGGSKAPTMPIYAVAKY